MNPRRPGALKATCLALAGLIFAEAAGAATLPAGFAETRIAGGLDPVSMSFADGRLFVCEKHGLPRMVRTPIPSIPPVTRNLPDAAVLELLEAWVKSKTAG